MNEIPSDAAPLLGYLRQDGRKGIRNVVAVAYLVECAHHVAREIVTQFAPRLMHAGSDVAADEEADGQADGVSGADFDAGDAHDAAPELHLVGFPGW